MSKFTTLWRREGRKNFQVPNHQSSRGELGQIQLYAFILKKCSKIRSNPKKLFKEKSYWEEEERKMKVEEESEWEEDDWGMNIEVKETSEEVEKRLAERTWEEIQKEQDRKWKKDEEEDRKWGEMEKMLAKRTLEEMEESRKMKVDKQLPSAQPSSSKRSRPDSAEYFFFGSPIPKKRRFRYFTPRWARVDEREKKPCLISQPCGGEKEERTSKCTTISPQEEN